ncbi:MAG: NUDIX domain-containing protein [Acidimicrobiales bacterium]
MTEISYDPSAFPPFAVTVDIAVFTLIDLPVPVKSGQAPRKELAAVLIVRGGDTEAGSYALPGGFVLADEDLSAAAIRELHEEAGLELPVSAIHQFRAYGDPDRDPRMRVVTIAHTALATIDVALNAGTDAKAVEIVPVRKILSGEFALAFDHEQILHDALAFIRGLIEETSAVFELCPEAFTLTELRHVCEAVWGYKVDRATFNKRVITIDGFLEPEDSDSEPLAAEPGRRGRPATKYRRGTADTLHPPLLRPRERLRETESLYSSMSLQWMSKPSRDD